MAIALRKRQKENACLQKVNVAETFFTSQMKTHGLPGHIYILKANSPRGITHNTNAASKVR